MKTLVAGWFSFEQMGASAGDLLARDVACEWLERAGRSYEIALAPPFEGGVDWRAADPAEYAEVLFVCGPVGNGPPLVEFLERFRGRRLIGLNVTMLDRIETWNPFDVLYERDSSATTRPDLAFLARAEHVPVVGVVLIDAQPEYGEGDLHDPAHRAIDELLATRAGAAVRIDTRLDANATGLRTPAEIESLIARMDVVVTTRLHGLVLALKNGVPALAVDSVAGGAKVSRQAESVGWPIVLRADALDGESLRQAFDHCLTGSARDSAAACARRAATILEALRDDFVDRLGRE